MIGTMIETPSLSMLATIQKTNTGIRTKNQRARFRSILLTPF
jgi:hypothetical protein